MVSTNKALAHLKKLSDAGVGYKSVASACSVGHTTLLKIITGRVKRIRVSTEREILSVDEDALADGALVPAGPTNELLKQLLQLGFRKRELARHLGVETPRLQLGTRDRVQLHTAAKVEKLVRQLARGEVVPKAWCTPGEAQELVRREIDIPRPDGPLSAVDAFLHELRELRELRRLSPKNMNKQPGEAMINLANFKETT